MVIPLAAATYVAKKRTVEMQKALIAALVKSKAEAARFNEPSMN